MSLNKRVHQIFHLDLENEMLHLKGLSPQNQYISKYTLVLYTIPIAHLHCCDKVAEISPKVCGHLYIAPLVS